MNNSKKLQLAPWLIFLIGMHSIFLGIFIYFFTDIFYQMFFAASVENPFFVRQSGVFLFLAGFFYLFPLLNLKVHYNLILVVIFSKAVAVLFLVSNASYTHSPIKIYIAAFFDGLMGVLLIFTYVLIKKQSSCIKSPVTGTGDIVT
ncbi:MAG: hypothetical protein KAI35_00785 [Desulfobulbaceae bacterium]|nr:hypothetical protein [Desulfobulbaceae bacterium]